MPRDTLKSLTAAAVQPEYSVITPELIAAREVLGYRHMFSAADVAAATKICDDADTADMDHRATYLDESEAILAACNQFARSYIAAACYDVEYKHGDPRADSDKATGINPDDIEPATLRAMVADCAKFERENRDLLDRAMELSGNDDGQAGYDFYMTRVGHGVGFWETPDWPEAEGEELTKAAKKYGEFNLMIGDNGAVTS